MRRSDRRKGSKSPIGAALEVPAAGPRKRARSITEDDKSPKKRSVKGSKRRAAPPTIYEREEESTGEAMDESDA